MLIKHWVTGHLRERLIQEALERGETIHYETSCEAESVKQPDLAPSANARFNAVIAAVHNDHASTVIRDAINDIRFKLSATTVGDYTFVDCPIWTSNGLYTDPDPLNGVPLRILHSAQVVFDKNNLVTGVLQNPPKSRSDELSETIFQMALASDELKSKFGVQP